MAEIQIWPFHKAPKALRQTAAGASEWLVLIPAALVSNTIESLFWRWHDEEHPVNPPNAAGWICHPGGQLSECGYDDFGRRIDKLARVNRKPLVPLPLPAF